MAPCFNAVILEPVKALGKDIQSIAQDLSNIGQKGWNWLQAKTQTSDDSKGGQVKLPDKEAEKAAAAVGEDIHDLKNGLGNKNGDLYVNKGDGKIYLKPKGGQGEGEYIGVRKVGNQYIPDNDE